MRAGMTDTLEPTPEAWDLIGDIGMAWGADWARTIRDEIATGTFVELDGRPCAVKCSRAPEAPLYRQERLV